MKKIIPYLLAAVLAGAILALYVTGNRNRRKQLDERVTLRRQDKIPYATYVAFNNLKHLFPAAKVRVSRQEPGYWDSVSMYDSKQAYIAITDRFSADEAEMKKLIAFARAGNDVFISARYVSSAADQLLQCASSAFEQAYTLVPEPEEEVRLSLSTPPFTDTIHYQYPGRSYYSYFSHVDTSITQVLGYDQSGRPDFIRLRTGMGNFFVHLEPLAFSNYFLLHERNMSYYTKALSVIDTGVTRIVWDEYYLYKKKETGHQKKKGWLAVLMSMKNAEGEYPFRAAFWLLLLLLLLYVLMEMRRRQRYIPVLKKPRNDSLDFVKTIGRLYYDKSDHLNLSRKMAAYFLEHVRSRYKLSTGLLNEEFTRNLHFKSGVSETEIAEITGFIKYLDQAGGLSEKQLLLFHKQLESFYQKA